MKLLTIAIVVATGFAFPSPAQEAPAGPTPVAIAGAEDGSWLMMSDDSIVRCIAQDVGWAGCTPPLPLPKTSPSGERVFGYTMAPYGNDIVGIMTKSGHVIYCASLRHSPITCQFARMGGGL